MKRTSRALLPRKSSRRTVEPVTTSVSAKSGAMVPSSSMVDSVSDMENSFMKVWALGFAASHPFVRRGERKDGARSFVLEQRGLTTGYGQAEVLVGQSSCNAAARCTVEKADLNEEWLVDLLERIFLFG